MQILIFTRYPVPGKSKTRLIPALGPERAARLQRLMTEHVLAQAEKFCLKENLGKGKIKICCDGARAKHFRAWLGPGYTYQAQPKGNLGQRMGWILKKSFRSAKKPFVLIGSDLP
jgi:hypothetical protein